MNEQMKLNGIIICYRIGAKMKTNVIIFCLLILFPAIPLNAQDIGLFIPEWANDLEFKKQVKRIHELITKEHGNNAIAWEIKVKIARDRFNKECHDSKKRHIVNGVIESELENWHAAKNDFTAAIQSSPNSSIGYLFHAISAYHCKEIEACAASSTTFIEMEPESEFAKLLLVECSLILGDYWDAYKKIIKLCDNHPDNQYYYTRFKEVTFILIAKNDSLKEENDSLNNVIRLQEAEIERLKKENSKLRIENTALKERIRALEERNRHIQYALEHPNSRIKVNPIKIIFAIAGVITPYKPLQILCAIIGLIPNP